MKNICYAFLILLFATSSHATENLVQNGGFEELVGGFPTGWVPFQGGGEGASFEVVPDQFISYEGNISARLTNLFELKEAGNLSIVIQSHAEAGLPIWVDDVKVRMQHFGERVNLGLIEYNRIGEASGIAASRKNKDVLWTHNDSGDLSYIYAFNTHGKHLGRYYIYGVSSVDWEDMAIGPDPVDGEYYIYIGEIGDNNARRDLKYIYRVPEPDVDADQSPVDTTLSGAERLAFRYPDGKRDAETLMVDPLTGDIYVVSKRETNVRVYRAPYPQTFHPGPTTEAVTLEHVATLGFSDAVGGDISPSGLEILIKTYHTIYYWCRTPEQKLWQAFDDDPLRVPYIPEPQGEAVCWAPDGLGYYTISEGRPTYLYFYPRLDLTPVADVREIEEIPACFLLMQNYSNPFNSSTRIRYRLPETSRVELAIYDVLGRRVEVLVDGLVDAGDHSVRWDADCFASGIYFVRMRAGDFTDVRRMVLIR